MMINNNNNNNNISNKAYQAAGGGQPTSRDQLMAEYQVGNAYASAAPGPSPYHSASGSVMGPPSPRTETRSDITQQINAAIIGSSEAEFQNDFIQVSCDAPLLLSISGKSMD